MQGKARTRVCIVVPPHQSPDLIRRGGIVLHQSLPLRAKEMSTGARPSSIDELNTFTARLDGLRVDQDPDDLSNALRAAFEKPELYDLYISSLVGDTERAKTLLEVFDKVRSEISSPIGWFSVLVYGTGASGDHMRYRNLQASSATVRLDGVSTNIPHHSQRAHSNDRGSRHLR